MKKVRIKTWEEMKKEFGVNKNNFIKCDAYFTPDMECSMPENRVIEVRGESKWLFFLGFRV